MQSMAFSNEGLAPDVKYFFCDDDMAAKVSSMRRATWDGVEALRKAEVACRVQNKTSSVPIKSMGWAICSQK